MKVFLLSKVPGCGEKGEVKDVASGYASNFLIPRGLAVAVSSNNEGDIKGRVKSTQERVCREKAHSKDIANKISSLELSFSMRAKDNGTDLYGSLSAATILAELNKVGFSFEKSDLIFSTQIKTVGKHSLRVKVASDIKAPLVVNVIKE